MSFSEMGHTAVEIILFGHETIKFKDKLDICDEKIQKGCGWNWKHCTRKKKIYLKKKNLWGKKNVEQKIQVIFAEISIFFFLHCRSQTVKGIIIDNENFWAGTFKIFWFRS